MWSSSAFLVEMVASAAVFVIGAPSAVSSAPVKTEAAREQLMDMADGLLL